MIPGAIFSRTADGDTGISYDVYVPTAFVPDYLPPMILAFSPSGDGGGMIHAMKESAEKVGWILVGANDLQNDMDESIEPEIEDELLNDLFSKLSYDPRRVYLAGFSGGAMPCIQHFRQTRREDRRHYCLRRLARRSEISGSALLQIHGRRHGDWEQR